MSGGFAYRDMTFEQLNAAYNNRAHAGDWRSILDRWARDSRDVYRNRPVFRDLEYGPQPRQRLDIFPARSLGRPTLFYVHGGYWQWLEKEEEAFVVEGPLAHDLNVVLCEYRLCPSVMIGEIVADVSAAIDWLAPRLTHYGAHPDRLIVGGSSAGAHLAAMCLGRPEIKAALLISGIYDLEPIRHSWLNDTLHFTADSVRRNSPILRLPDAAGPTCFAVGTDELPEMMRQTREYQAAWLSNGLPGWGQIVPKTNHFTVMDQLATGDGALTRSLLDLCRWLQWQL